MSRPVLIVAPGEPGEPFIDALCSAGGAADRLDAAAALPGGAGGLLVAGDAPFGLLGESVPPAVYAAIEADMPVLGVGWGMFALNVALGGRPPVRIADAVAARPRPGRSGKHSTVGPMRTFLTLGGKVAATIGAGGAVATPGVGEYAIREAEKAPGLMASAYGIETGAVEALEMPGFHWVIGVAWPLHKPDLLPAQFQHFFAAFVERSRG